MRQYCGDATPEPSESQEQQWLMQWAMTQRYAMPELKRLYHIPNEGMRTKTTGRRMVAEGLKKGVPDLCLPVARCGYHGLYIELKRRKTGKTSAEQTEWIEGLRSEKYMAIVCHGWQSAADALEAYLRGKYTRGVQNDAGGTEELQMSE